ncbi:MAG: hypothetical protein HY078_11025 [Elusimicrobia bacterium]|nr:hypothetical protein [Elusimicrobiota bacterium]
MTPVKERKGREGMAKHACSIPAVRDRVRVTLERNLRSYLWKTSRTSPLSGKN